MEMSASGYPLDQLSTGLLRSFVVELESHRTANALASAYFHTWGNHAGHNMWLSSHRRVYTIPEYYSTTLSSSESVNGVYSAVIDSP